MNKQTAIAIAKKYFPFYLTVVAFHITSDEQVFEDLHHAHNHAKSLDKDAREVITVTREEAEAESTEGGEGNRAGAPPAPPADETKEQKLERLKAELSKATELQQLKQQVLNDCSARNKGAATVQFNKAKAAMQAAKDALEAAMQEQ